MFWDQWDYFYSLFYGGGWWDRFIHQHGPVREGLGWVVSAWILEATKLDVRYDSIWIATVLLVATVLALRLTWKLTGTLGYRDGWIPILCLSLGQFESVVMVPNASHSVFPLALILLAANVWISSAPALRYLGAAAIAFAVTFTGFGLFAGAMIAVLLAAAVVRHARMHERRPTWLAAAGLAIVVAGWVTFSKGYVFHPAVEGFRLPWTPWTDYVRFVILMLNLPTGEIGERTPHYLMGSVLAVVLASAAAGIVRLWARRTASPKDEVLVLLVGSGLLFVAATAVGRVSLGVLAGTASRYLTLMFPMWLAVYLLAATSHRRVLLLTSVCVWILALGPYESMPRRALDDWPGTAGITRPLLEVMRSFGANKAAWADVYLETGSWEAAQAAVMQPLYPDPASTMFDHKLRILRERKLSFFAGEPNRRDYHPWLADDRFSCPALRSSPPVCQ